MRSARLLPVAIAALVLTPAGGAAQESYTLEDVSFLTGCWVGDMGSLILEEQSTAAQGGVMLGTTRFIRDGTVVDWEFGRMVEEDGVVTLWPYPRGTISTDGFPLVRAGQSSYSRTSRTTFRSESSTPASTRLTSRHGSRAVTVKLGVGL